MYLIDLEGGSINLLGPLGGGCGVDGCGVDGRGVGWGAPQQVMQAKKNVAISRYGERKARQRTQSVSKDWRQ